MGDYGVGKSTFMRRAMRDEKFIPDDPLSPRKNSRGGAFVHEVKTIVIDAADSSDAESKWVKVSLDIFDTKGDEKYSTLQKPYYDRAHGAILMYDLSQKETFENTRLWVKESQRFAHSNKACILYLLGSKMDKVRADSKFRKVSRKDVKDSIVMQDQEIHVLGEVNCKNKTAVDKVFEEVAYSLVHIFPHRIREIQNKENKKDRGGGDGGCCVVQ